MNATEIKVPQDNFMYLGKLVYDIEAGTGHRVFLCRQCGCMVPSTYITYHLAKAHSPGRTV